MRYTVGVLTLALGISFASHCQAVDELHQHTDIGKVSKVGKRLANPKIIEITVSSHGHDLETVKADASTKVTKGTDAATVEDIEVGTAITAVVDDQKHAVSIKIMPAKKKPAEVG